MTKQNIPTFNKEKDSFLLQTAAQSVSLNCVF